MRRHFWLVLLALTCTPALASKIQVEPDPAGTKFELTTESQGVVLNPDTDTNFSVKLAKLDSANPYDPPREPVEGWFDLQAGAPDGGNEFSLKVGIPYDVLLSDDILPITVIVQKVEGSEFEADTFLRSVHDANLTNPATLVRHFWLAKEIWEARKAVLDKGQREINLYDVGVAYYYVVLTREILNRLTVAPPDSSIEAANWLTNLAGVAQPSKRLFNDQSVPSKSAREAAASLKSIAGIQDGRVGRIINAVEVDLTDAGGAFDDTICGRANETLRVIAGLTRSQWGKAMPGYRTRALMYASNCLARTANTVAKGEGDRLGALKAQSEPLINALSGLKPKTGEVRSVVQVLKDALANAAKRI